MSADFKCSVRKSEVSASRLPSRHCLLKPHVDIATEVRGKNAGGSLFRMIYKDLKIHTLNQVVLMKNAFRK